MSPSHPRDPKAPGGARRPPDEPAHDRLDERSTVEVRAESIELLREALQLEDDDDSCHDRATLPPPIPVSEYVQTMMLQAESDEPLSEPPISHAPLSWRGEPPLSLKSKVTSDPITAPSSVIEGLPPSYRSPWGPGAVRGRLRPPSEGPDILMPMEPEPWPEEDAPVVAPPPVVIQEPAKSELKAALSAVTQPSMPKPVFPAPERQGPPPRRPSSKLNLPAMAPIPMGIAPPPPSSPKITSVDPGPASTPSVGLGTMFGRRSPGGDADLDHLPYDELLDAATTPGGPSPMRSFTPPTRVMPSPVNAPPPSRGAAGLRLGKEPLSSFPPVLDVPDEDAGPIPAILDTAWAFGPTSGDEASHAPLLPTRHPPDMDEDELEEISPESDPPPPILDVDWALPETGYDEASEVTTVGSPDEEADPGDPIEACFQAGDLVGALQLAEQRLALYPTDEYARYWADRARAELTEAYAEHLGGRRQIPHVNIRNDQIRWLSLDHRAGFLLSCVDSHMSIEEVLDVSGMPELDALRILCDLRDQGVITFDVRSHRSTRR